MDAPKLTQHVPDGDELLAKSRGKYIIEQQNLQAGDIVSVVGANGKTLRFRVTGVQSYDDASAPITAIFGPSDGRHLNLITCDGAWDSATGAYTKRLVVFTELVGP